MRDVERIGEFCKTFQRYWEEKVPNWRVGRLISNFFCYVAKKGKSIYFVEDEEMSELLDDFFAENA